jgi:hypothetical protein
MSSHLSVVLVTLMISLVVPATAQNSGQVLHVKSSGNAEAWVHFDPVLLSKYALDGSDLAKAGASILNFQAATWGFQGSVAWDVYISDQTDYRDSRGEPEGTNDYSATEKVPGATKPGPLACVTRIGLQTIQHYVSAVVPENGMALEEPFNSRVAYTMAHEATHCYQGVTSKVHKGPGAYRGAKWLTEGVAGWLAGDYIESTGRPYPSYYEVGFRDNHRRGLLALSNSNHFFFKWLEGAQALKSRGAVLAFVTDMFEVPWPESPGNDCVMPPTSQSCYTALYEGLVKQWFQSKRNTTIANVLVTFASAVVRGTVPGIRAPTLFLSRSTETLPILPGFDKARLAILATGVPTPVPLGQLKAIPTRPNMKDFVPDSFGFVAFELRLSKPIMPPPHGYLVAMEGGNDDVVVRLSNEKSDTGIDDSRWIRTNFLEGQWFSIVRTDRKAGQDARILLKALP